MLISVRFLSAQTRAQMALPGALRICLANLHAVSSIERPIRKGPSPVCPCTAINMLVALRAVREREFPDRNTAIDVRVPLLFSVHMNQKEKKKKTTEEKKKRKKTDPFFRHVPSLGLSRIRQRQIRPRLLPRAPVPRALLPGPASPRQQELRCALLLQAELPQRAS